MIPLSWINSAKFRLVKLFHFFATPQEDSLSVDFIFVVQATGNPASDILVFGEAAAKSPGGRFSLLATSYLFVTFIDIPACRQVEIMFVTEIDLNTMFSEILFLTDSHFCSLSASICSNSESHHSGALLWNKPNSPL